MTTEITVETTPDPAFARAGVVLVAAGSGTRLGAGVPKAFVDVGGRPLIHYALSIAARFSDAISVVVPVDLLDPAHPLWAGVEVRTGATVVAGGESRTESVSAGLEALPADRDITIVHDAARAFAPVSLYRAVVAAVADGATGAVPGLEPVDTVKVVDADGFVQSTPDRSSLRSIQTPQAFDAGVLRAVHKTRREATDDAALAEEAGGRIRVVPGHPHARKITTPDDLDWARGYVTQGWRA